jgi:hypothetical protein
VSPGAEPKEPSPYWPGLGGPVLLLLLTLFLFVRPLLLLGDGGTCRHFLTGIYILEHQAIPTTTYLSAVEPNSAWITHELLCDLLFGLPFQALGLNWIVLTAALAITLSITWSYQMARRRGAGLAGALAAMVLALEACSVHWSARPHVFTYLFFLVCYYECFAANGSWRRRALVLSVIMLVWGNSHGSFALGLAMIACRALGDLAQSKSVNQAGNLWTGRQSAIIFFSAFLASCLNVRGAGFINYVLAYLASPKIQAQSDEWRSIDFSFAGPVWSFIALACLLFTLWVYSKVKPKLGEFAFMTFLFFASIYAMRLIPYFALAVLPAMATQAGELRLRESLLSVPCLGKLLAANNRASQSELELLKSRWLFAGMAAVLSLIFLLAPPFRISDFDPARMPVGAVNYIKDHGISGLGFTKDNWGSYLYWRLKSPIFIDDRTDFYSQKVLDDYTAIFLSIPGWQNNLAKYPFQFILIPRGLPLEFILRNEQSWKCCFEDRTAALFTREPDQKP